MAEEEEEAQVVEEEEAAVGIQGTDVLIYPLFVYAF